MTDTRASFVFTYKHYLYTVMISQISHDLYFSSNLQDREENLTESHNKKTWLNITTLLTFTDFA